MGWSACHLKRGSDTTSHARDIVNELCVPGQVANKDIFEQPTAKPFLRWWCNRGATAFFPIQLQHSSLHTPLHTYTTFGA